MNAAPSPTASSKSSVASRLFFGRCSTEHEDGLQRRPRVPYAPPSPMTYVAPPIITGLLLCRVKSANGQQNNCSPYSVSCTMLPHGVCKLQFDTNDGAELTETRTFTLPPSRKVT